MTKLKNALRVVFLSNRAKSLYWRTSMMLIAGLCKLIADSAPLVPDMSPDVAVLLGLVFGEVSKSLNNKYGLKK